MILPSGVNKSTGLSVALAELGISEHNAVAVGDAVPEVKQTAHYTTKALAGHGAIRETVELILKSKGIWDSMIDKARA